MKGSKPPTATAGPSTLMWANLRRGSVLKSSKLVVTLSTNLKES